MRPPISLRLALRRWLAPPLALTLATVAGCGASGPDDPPTAIVATAPTVPPPDSIATGAPSPEVDAATAELFADPLAPPSEASLDIIGSSNDLRLGWYLADRLHYVSTADAATAIASRLEQLTGVEMSADADPWTFYVDLLLAWDVPTPPSYLERKGELHLAHDPKASPFFDATTQLDWRLVSGTGAALGDVVPLVDPEVVASPGEVRWLGDGDVVFGVHVEGEWRAYPRRVLRAHEIVHDTVGERRIVVTWCEVCGAAVAWYADGYEVVANRRTDGVGALDLEPSGLALRGAPLAYDDATASLLDTFAGVAVTGPMADAHLKLDPLTTVATSWADWSRAHPATSVVSDDGGVGRIYVDEADSPTPTIWPAGVRDARLEGDRMVLGVRRADGELVAFVVDAAAGVVSQQGELNWSGIDVAVDGGGLVATDRETDRPLVSHEANWRSWSQFHPDTQLWSPGS